MASDTLRIMIAGGAGAILGFTIGRWLAPTIGRAIGREEEEVTVSPLMRMTEDAIYACDTMTPILRQLRASLADRSLSASELAALYRQIEGLT